MYIKARVPSLISEAPSVIQETGLPVSDYNFIYFYFYPIY